jgi:hypothetical protein
MATGGQRIFFFFFFFLQITRKEKIKASLATVSFKVAPKKIHKSVARLAAVLQHIFLCFLFFFRQNPNQEVYADKESTSLSTSVVKPTHGGHPPLGPISMRAAATTLTHGHFSKRKYVLVWRFNSF